MGSRLELERLTQLVTTAAIEPAIDSVMPLSSAAEGFAAMARGDVVGKIVFSV
jgi:D-arabinose 1-dehydrogenase-like Zn-dependent alcohol dehydrogenase